MPNRTPATGSRRRLAAGAAVLVALVPLTACGDDGAPEAGGASPGAASAPADRPTPGGDRPGATEGALPGGDGAGNTGSTGAGGAGSPRSACGDPAPVAGGWAALAARLPAEVSSRDTADGTVTLTAKQAVRGAIGGAAEIVLARDGRIVGLPGPHTPAEQRLDLTAGGKTTLPVFLAPEACAGGGDPGLPGVGTLAPGGYQVYARVTLTRGDGRTDVAVGGPWPLTVR